MTDLVWEQTVDDGTYRCWVERTEDYTGILRVEHVDDHQLLLETDVGLAYQARFGPDIADVDAWRTLSIRVIDDDYRARGKRPPT
jgi:hypothetical protein